MAACHKSPVSDVTAGSNASVVAVSVVFTVSGVAADAPNGPTTSGAISHTPALTGLPVSAAATVWPWPDAISGSPVGAPRSNWMGSLPVVVAVAWIAVVWLGTR